MRAIVVWSLVLLGCAASQEPTRERSTMDGLVGVAQLESSERDFTVSDQMWHHFADVAKARDAVIHGDLEATRSPLNRLAQGQYGVETPDAWAQPLARMRTVAREGARAAEISAAAGAVASVASQCGQCHKAQGVHPQVSSDAPPYRPHSREGLSEAMARHVFAAEELWLGMTIPDEPTWQRGAQALAHTEPPPPPEPSPAPAAPDWEAGDDPPPPPAAPAPEPPALEPELAQAIEDIRALGDDATAATTAEAREALYATLITRCGDCHKRMGVQ